jgi:hypothetical protein
MHSTREQNVWLSSFLGRLVHIRLGRSSLLARHDSSADSIAGAAACGRGRVGLVAMKQDFEVMPCASG